MLDLEIDVGSTDLLEKYHSVKNQLMQVTVLTEDRWAIAAMLLVAAARAVARDDPYGTFKVYNLPVNGDANVAITLSPTEAPKATDEPATETKPTKLPKPKMKTSIQPKKGPVRKNQEPDPRKQRVKVGEDLYMDGNGYYFDKQGQAVGKNGKPTADPYNINIDPTLPPGPSVPVVPQGSAGFYGAQGGDDF